MKFTIHLHLGPRSITNGATILIGVIPLCLQYQQSVLLRLNTTSIYIVNAFILATCFGFINHHVAKINVLIIYINAVFRRNKTLC